MNNSVLDILKKIESNGFKAYIVGGYPRDLYMGKETNDYDISTNATPMDIKQIFSNSTLKREQYGSVTLFYNDLRFEITTFRKDIKYYNNRKPIEIEYIDSLIEDLKRRDFVINTICIDSNGKYIDLLNGKADIDKKIIRTVGDSYKKIEEDSLRILRAVRFATVLDFELDKRLKDAIIKYKYLLKNLSYYRKKEELDKIFASPNCSKGIQLIKELNLAPCLELSNIDKIVPTTYLDGVWAQLDVLDKYSFNNSQKNTIKKINELLNKNILEPINIYKYGLYLSTIAAEIKRIGKKEINEIYNNLDIYNKSDIKISAEEICNILDKKSGNFIKKIYDDLEYKIVNKILENNEIILKEYIKKNFN